MVAHHIDVSKPAPDIGRLPATQAARESLSAWLGEVKTTTNVQVLMGKFQPGKGCKIQQATTKATLKAELQRWAVEARTEMGQQEAAKSLGGNLTKHDLAQRVAFIRTAEWGAGSGAQEQNQQEAEEEEEGGQEGGGG